MLYKSAFSSLAPYLKSLFSFVLAPTQFASILQKANVKIRDHSECKKIHGKDKSGENYLVADETVCASVSTILPTV